MNKKGKSVIFIFVVFMLISCNNKNNFDKEYNSYYKNYEKFEYINNGNKYIYVKEHFFTYKNNIVKDGIILNDIPIKNSNYSFIIPKGSRVCFSDNNKLEQVKLYKQVEIKIRDNNYKIKDYIYFDDDSSIKTIHLVKEQKVKYKDRDFIFSAGRINFYRDYTLQGDLINTREQEKYQKLLFDDKLKNFKLDNIGDVLNKGFYQESFIKFNKDHSFVLSLNFGGGYNEKQGKYKIEENIIYLLMDNKIAGYLFLSGGQLYFDDYFSRDYFVYDKDINLPWVSNNK